MKITVTQKYLYYYDDAQCNAREKQMRLIYVENLYTPLEKPKPINNYPC